MRYGSVCSGIESASVAWHPLGWEAAWFTETDRFASAVLAHRWPDVRNLGDLYGLRERKDKELGPIDVLVGGTPCQSFSVAGQRGGMDDSRGQLTWEFFALAARLRPTWVVWENVPGVLSIEGGQVFGAILGKMGELGYGFAYRVLDARYFGVPQRRRRVFIVGHLGDWRAAAAVLFERHSLSGHPPARREARPGGADLSANGVRTCGADDNQAQGGHVVRAYQCHGSNVGEMGVIRKGNGSVTSGVPFVAATLGGHSRRSDYETETFVTHPLLAKANDSHDLTKQTYVTHPPRAEGADASEDGTGRGVPLVAFNARQDPDVSGDVTHPLGALDRGHGVLAFDRAQITSSENRSNPKPGDPAPPLHPTFETPAIASSMAVRRLTPRECERLQGFPDDYTLVPYRRKAAVDGPRYRALGNAMAVPVMRWIGDRIELVRRALAPAAAAGSQEPR